MIKSDSLAKLAPALVKAQKNMGIALKDSKNPFFKSKYADLNAVIDAAIPAMNEQGIAVLQSPGLFSDPVTGVTTPVINTTFLHESGEYISGQSRVVANKQNDPQAEGSATTYARRYGLQAMAVLKADDDDGNAGSGKVTQLETKTASITKVDIPVTSTVKTNDIETATVTTSPAPKKSGPWGAKKTTKAEGDLY